MAEICISCVDHRKSLRYAGPHTKVARYLPEELSLLSPELVTKRAKTRGLSHRGHAKGREAGYSKGVTLCEYSLVHKGCDVKASAVCGTVEVKYTLVFKLEVPYYKLQVKAAPSTEIELKCCRSK